MLVRLLGKATLVRLEQEENAELPMLVTGRPSIVSGMATAPPGPRYLVIVSIPFVTV